MSYPDPAGFEEDFEKETIKTLSNPVFRNGCVTFSTNYMKYYWEGTGDRIRAPIDDPAEVVSPRWPFDAKAFYKAAEKTYDELVGK